MKKCFTRFGMLLFLALMIVPLATSGAQDENVIRYPITSDPELLNPLISDTIANGTILRNIFEGLTYYNPQSGEIEPAIAESWEITENDAGEQVFTFSLRQGVLFHAIAQVDLEDREVTADDILWNYETALSGDENVSILANQLSFIKGAAEYTAGEAESVEGLEVIDDYTFAITLAQPDRLFLINGMISILSPEAYDALGEGVNNIPVGTGPYQFVEWLREDRLVLEANPDYYKEGLPANDGIRFINYGDPNTALLDYRENNIDFLFSFPSGQRNAVIEEFSGEFIERPGLHVRYWGYNMEDGYLADKPLVRQALAHALDTETAWNIFDEGARFPAVEPGGLLVPAMPSSTPSVTYLFDMNTAAALLEEAGYPGGEGLETISIYLLESISGEAQVVVWEEALGELGVPIEFVIEDGSTYWDSIVTENADIFLNGWAAGLIDPSDVFDFLILDGSGSMRYDNPEVNDLLRAARIELDEAARTEIYQQVHNIVMEEAVVIPSAYSKVSWLQKPWVDGFVPGGGGTYTAPLWNVTLSR